MVPPPMTTSTTSGSPLDMDYVEKIPFTVKQLEAAVEGCQARIVVVCNACQSARLASKRWTLICAAGPTQYSDAIAQSASGNVRGSMFTLCVTTQIAAEFGLKVQAEGRSLMESLSEPDALVSLPSSPPDHSFLVDPSTSLPIHPPSDRPIRPFVDDAQALQDFLVYKPTAYFQLLSNSESAEDLTWYNILPSGFTETMGRETTLYPDNTSLLKELLGGPQLHGGEPQSEDSAFFDSDSSLQTLVRLSLVYVALDTDHFTQEARDSKICEALLRHVEDPQNPSPFRGSEGRDFCELLQRRNIQAVAVQDIARGFGWWSGDITPFVLSPGGDYRRARDEMIGAGMPIDQIPRDLGRLFQELVAVEDPPAIYWLVARWVAVDRSLIPWEHWEHVVAAAVDSTATSDALIQ
ncbi:hypothetical protein MVEN_02606200 [Mycena venus]|uniref:Uncharacterized protein n=1 Tax=Mycena venus TaxID=2733690 RepID=A0A8H6TWG4_9AGAR|nr:hypothetical protein MVEN_02606200 [Mycena venus]